MKKGTKKSQIERRKHPRRADKPALKPLRKSSGGLSDVSALSLTQEHCVACGKGLKSEDRALFVEEEVGRIFCSEECITQNFQSEIDQIEKAYFKYRPKDDLTPEEREQFAHLRWITIQEPDEVWQEKRANGDKRHTLISRFKPGAKPIWCVCICLFLRGEPSFLYMAFPTRSRALVDKFRKGKKIELAAKPIEADSSAFDEEPRSDGLAANGWSQSETLRADILGTRDASESNEIPPEEYALFEPLLEKTLEDPDELWIMSSKDDGVPDRYHFMKHFPEEESGPVYYIVVAQESEQTEHLEILEQIPTRNEERFKRYRKGRQEKLTAEDEAMSKTVH